MKIMEKLIALVKEKSIQSGKKEDFINYNRLKGAECENLKDYLNWFEDRYVFEVKSTKEEDKLRNELCKEFNLLRWRKMLIGNLLNNR